MAAERTAIVTGAGKRVGAAIAAALVADGWAVLAHVHHEGDRAPDGATKVVADLAERDCGTRIFAAADALPPVRLLVNTASVEWSLLPPRGKSHLVQTINRSSLR